MAVDTRNKRSSVIMMGLGFGRVFPEPDSSLADVEDRFQISLSYAEDFTVDENGVIHVQIGSTWMEVVPKVYLGTEWVVTPVKLYKSGNWTAV